MFSVFAGVPDGPFARLAFDRKGFIHALAL